VFSPAAALPMKVAGTSAVEGAGVNRLRTLRVGARLAGSFAVLAVVLVGVVLSGMAGYRIEQREAARVATALELTHHVMEAKFRTADFAGWQTGYAFDITRGVPGADQDTQGQRAEFLASTAAFRAEVKAVLSYPLTPPERALLADASTEFDAFMAVDRQIIGSYRQHGAAATRKANDLASGESLDHFGKLAQDVSKVADSVVGRGATAAVAATAAASTGKRVMVLAGVLGLLLAALFAILITMSVTGPLRALDRRLAGIAGGGGDLTTRLPETGGDELTGVSRSFNQFVGSLQTLIRDVASSASSLSAAATELVTVGGTLSHSAEQTSSQAELVSAAADGVGTNLRTVAAGAEEMGASIREIAQNAAEAARIGATAVTTAQATNATIGKLGRSSKEIGGVLTVITTIAEQTNLLALNATIEAARAGEAGKGFAVVASEVKELAQETANATETIRQRIGTIQADTTEAVTAIDTITTVIGQISDYTSSIAGAVEEQTATTNEMARSVATASGTSERISGTIDGVAAAAATTSTAAAASQTAAGTLTQLSDQLTGLVRQFRT
jgi:methyl-accepting chemotaxis protein